MKIVLLGEPGSGKGTQAEFLVKEFKIPLVSTGNILRQAVLANDELGKYVKDCLSAGNLVPNDVMKELVKKWLNKEECKQGFVLDGYPRLMQQAKDLEEITPVDYVIYITVPEEVVIERISNRRVCKKCCEPYNLINNPPKKPGICDKCGGELYHRDDDKEETIKHRLDIYKKDTKPLIDYYKEKGILKEIDGNQEIKRVFEDICKSLE